MKDDITKKLSSQPSPGSRHARPPAHYHYAAMPARPSQVTQLSSSADSVDAYAYSISPEQNLTLCSAEQLFSVQFKLSTMVLSGMKEGVEVRLQPSSRMLTLK